MVAVPLGWGWGTGSAAWWSLRDPNTLFLLPCCAAFSSTSLLFTRVPSCAQIYPLKHLLIQRPAYHEHDTGNTFASQNCWQYTSCGMHPGITRSASSQAASSILEDMSCLDPDWIACSGPRSAAQYVLHQIA